MTPAGILAPPVGGSANMNPMMNPMMGMNPMTGMPFPMGMPPGSGVMFPNPMDMGGAGYNPYMMPF